PNAANVNKPLKLGYVYKTTPTGYYAGTKLLTNGPFNCYSIDNDTVGVVHNINIYYGYTDAQKWTTLSTAKDQAGGGSGDVSQVVSSGPFTLAAGDSVKVAFALIGGDNLNDLVASANCAQSKYLTLGVPNAVSAAQEGTLSVYPNPAS